MLDGNLQNSNIINQVGNWNQFSNLLIEWNAKARAKVKGNAIAIHSYVGMQMNVGESASEKEWIRGSERERERRKIYADIDR